MPWTYIQGGVGSHTSGTGTSLALTFAGNVTAGDLILVGVSANAVNGGLSVGDSSSNVYLADVTESSGFETAIFRAVASATGALTVTITSVDAVFISGCIDEFQASAAISLDSTASATGTSTTPSSGTCAVSGSSDLVYGLLSHESTSLPATEGAPFVGTYNLAFQAGNHFGISAQYALNQSAGIAATWTTASALWCAVAASYAAAVISSYSPWIFGDQTGEMWG
jgi:hypothetical protein